VGTEAQDNRELLAKLEREQERVRDENEWIRVDAEAEAVAKQAERELRGTIPANSLRWILPANADPLAPQDPARRAEFARHLAEIAEGMLLDRTPLPTIPQGIEAPANDRDRLSVGACTACRGSCCRAGGDHAYLTEETLARVLHDHPDRTLAQVLETYLQLLPAETVRDSCVYHSATGCGLPRELRSETCNQYLCGKLRNLQAGLPENKPPPLLAVMFDDGKWARTALIDQNGVKILAEE